LGNACIGSIKIVSFFVTKFACQELSSILTKIQNGKKIQNWRFSKTQIRWSKNDSNRLYRVRKQHYNDKSGVPMVSDRCVGYQDQLVHDYFHEDMLEKDKD
jgi:tRNA(His) 5'-end guanylyltransferase